MSTSHAQAFADHEQEAYEAMMFDAAAEVARSKDRIFHYVTYDRVRDWLAAGWMVVMPGDVHRQMHHYGIVMEWRCACPMVRPR